MNINTNRTCNKEVTGDLNFSKITIEYEKPMLNVNVWDHEAQQFVHCLSHDIELDYEGFFVIAASSGAVQPYHNYINSFELYDPTEVSTSHHYEDSHARKAEHEHYGTSIAATITDLIHDGAEEMDEVQWNEEDLMEITSTQMFWMPKNFEYTESLLQQMSAHFQEISGVMGEDELYDHTIKMNEGLF